MKGSTGEYSYFWLRRFHSILSVLFISAFLFFFVFPLSSVFGGKSYFNIFMGVFDSLPLLSFFEIAFVILPLIVHTAFAFFAIYSSSMNIVKYNYYRNWVYTLRRLTGILLIPFVAYHIFMTRIAFMFTGRAIDYSYMKALLTSPLIKVFYGVGIACAAYYLAASVISILFEWGITVSRRSRDIVSIVMWCFAIALFGWGLNIVFAFS